MSANELNEKDHTAGPFLFIVNPNSGTGKVESFLSEASQLIARNDVKVVVSQSPDHSIELATQAKQQGFNVVVAVGGDGSVHELGTQLIHQDIALGIIPTGSGNGVSRHLGISNEIETAVNQVLSGRARRMDTFTANDHPCIGFCGLGIDAAIARSFDESTERGFSSYVKLSIDAFTGYKPSEISYGYGTEMHTDICYTVVCSNISQFGNNAFINPLADDDDGLVELIAVRTFPAVQLMPLASRLFLKSIHKSKFVHTSSNDYFSVETQTPLPLHIDGEPMGSTTKLELKTIPRSLAVIIPDP